MKKGVAAVLVFAVVLGTVTLMRLTGMGIPLFNPVGDALHAMLSPVEGFFLRVGDGVQGTMRSLFSFRSVRRENEELQQSVDILTRENALLQEKLAAAGRSSALEEGGFQAVFWDGYRSIGASVISRDQNNWFQMIRINRGRRHGVTLNSPVVTHAGLVGKVVELTESTAQVLLITDDQGQASSFVRKEEGEAVYGVLYGANNHGSRLQGGSGVLRMDFKQEDEVTAGDVVLTSGLGGVYPKGILVGTILEVVMNPSGLMKTAYVQPAVRFDALEEVFVVVEGAEV